MKVDLERIKELAHWVVEDEPATGNVYVDNLYDSLNDIVGHTQPYYALFYMLSLEFNPDLVVELGAWRAIAAAHFAAGGAKEVLTIDIHKDDKVAQQIARDVDAHLDNLHYLNGWTWDAEIVARVKQSAPIDILFIDAWHEYKYAKREWDLYRPMLADEALVICDDIFDAAGATERMTDFWLEMSEGRGFLNADVHPGIPMGFMRWTK